jgi:hypothetical protein
MNAVFRWTVMPICACALAACATSAQRPPTLEELLAEHDYRLGEPVERIYNYRIDGWNYLDREHLILRDGARRKYLVTLVRQCNGLANSEVIAHTSTISSLTRHDKFLVRDAGRFVDDCYVKSLHKLEALEAAG